MQISPKQNIALAYQISDPYDTTTYFVRSVIRDTATGAVLATVPLADQGSGRFTAASIAPSDPTGLGRFIDVTTVVYTDSGYTTKSNLYQQDLETYVVKEFGSVGGGFGGGVDIDYKRIKGLVKELFDEYARANAPIAPDLGKIEAGLAKVLDAVSSIEIPKITIPEQKTVDLSGVLGAIRSASSEISSKIDSIEAPEQEKLDLSPVEALLEEVKKTLSGISKDVSAEEFSSRIKPVLDEIAKRTPNQENLSKMRELLASGWDASNIQPKQQRPHPMISKYIPQ